MSIHYHSVVRPDAIKWMRQLWHIYLPQLTRRQEKKPCTFSIHLVVNWLFIKRVCVCRTITPCTPRLHIQGLPPLCLSSLHNIVCTRDACHCHLEHGRLLLTKVEMHGKNTKERHKKLGPVTGPMSQFLHLKKCGWWFQLPLSTCEKKNHNKPL